MGGCLATVIYYYDKVKEPKNIDFYITDRQLSNEDFALISQWIATDKNIKGLKKRQKNRVHTKAIEND